MRGFGPGRLDDFLTRLGSDSPEPGGGAAAALVAASGMALLEMTARLNDKRLAKAGKLRRSAAKRIKAAKNSRKRLVWLMALDSAAFAEISRLHRLADRGKRYQEALQKGALVPMEIGALALQGLRMAALERPRTSRWLWGDLAQAGIFLEASLRGAGWNVEANLAGLSDRRLAKRLHSRLVAMKKDALRLAGLMQKAAKK